MRDAVLVRKKPTAPETVTVSSHPQWVNHRYMRIFGDTTEAELTVVLPANPLTGDQVDIYTDGNAYEENPCVVDPGTELINGQATAVNLTLPGLNVSIIYLGDTVGWKIVQLGETVFVGNGVNGFAQRPTVSTTQSTYSVPASFQNGILVVDTPTPNADVIIRVPNSDFLSKPWGFSIVIARPIRSLVVQAISPGDNVVGQFSTATGAAVGVVTDVVLVPGKVFYTGAIGGNGGGPAPEPTPVVPVVVSGDTVLTATHQKVRVTGQAVLTISDAIPPGWECSVKRETTEPVTFVVTGDDRLDSVDGKVAIANQNGWVALSKDAPGIVSLVGDLE